MRMCVFLPVCVCVCVCVCVRDRERARERERINHCICKPVVSELPLSFLLSLSDTLTMSGCGTTDPNHCLVTHVTQWLSLETCMCVCVTVYMFLFCDCLTLLCV